MKIALVGYGKMGKAIERLAVKEGHEIVARIGKDGFDLADLNGAEVAIEFSVPSAAEENVAKLLSFGIPTACGTTAWNSETAAINDALKTPGAALIHASNFSLGVNLFFAFNEHLAHYMSSWNAYAPSINEVHHTQKLDAPSGTAITTAEGILPAYPNLNGWSHNGTTANTLPITDQRIDPVCGTHTVTYNSSIDRISLEHHAHTRDGFALGALLAASWLQGKEGRHTMRDVLNIQPI